jgi:hypothetical protein
VTDETLGQLLTAVARMDMVLGDTTTTVGRSTGMTLADRAALTAAIVELLDELIDGVDFEPPADGNWQRHGETIKATDDVWSATIHARRATEAFARAASL